MESSSLASLKSSLTLQERTTSADSTSDDSPVQSSSKFPLDCTEIFQTAKTLLKSAIPTSLTYISEFIIGLICIRFVGTFGSAADLAGISLGFTWANAFCLGVFCIIDQGFSTLASRLFGAGKHHELGILFQRNLCVLTLLAVPLVVMLFFVEGVLVFLGLDPEIAASAGVYLRYIAPGTVGVYLFNAFRFYLISQEIFHIQGIVVTVLVPLHFVWCYLFIEHLGMSIKGAAIAKCITDCTGALALYIYITCSGKCKSSWIPWNKECLKHWGSYLKQTMLLGGYFYVEWISYEVSVFVVGALNNKFVLGAHGAALNVTIALFTIPLGNSITMQTYIGNAVGQGSKAKAQKFMIAGLGINTILTTINVLTLLFLNEEIASFFTSEAETKAVLQNILRIYAVAHIADTFANHLGGVLRVIGHEKQVFASYFFSYIIVAFNFQWYFGVVKGWGYIGVWLSTGLGMFIMLSLMIFYMLRMDWTKEINKLKETEDVSSKAESLDLEKNVYKQISDAKDF